MTFINNLLNPIFETISILNMSHWWAQTPSQNERVGAVIPNTQYNIFIYRFVPISSRNAHCIFQSKFRT